MLAPSILLVPSPLSAPSLLHTYGIMATKSFSLVFVFYRMI